MGVKLDPAAQELVDALSDLKAEAALSAALAVQTALLSLLVRKGVISVSEVETVVQGLEQQAASLRGQSPQLSQYVGQSALRIRNAFEGRQPRKPS